MKRRAFTLIEMILAVAILSVVAVTVSLVMRVGVESWRASTDLLDEGLEGEAVMEQIAMALRSAYYPANGEPTYEYGFQHDDDGDEDTAKDVFSWVKIGSSLIGEDVSWAGSAHRVKLYVGDDGEEDGPGLYAAAWQLVGQDDEFDEDEDVVPVLLSDRVIALDCRMRDPQKATEVGDPYEWIDEWTESNRIPTHVLVTLTLQPARKGADPDILRRMVEIPLSEVSWNPGKVGENNSRGNRNGRNNGNNGGQNGNNGGAPANGGVRNGSGNSGFHIRSGNNGGTGQSGNGGFGNRGGLWNRDRGNGGSDNRGGFWNRNRDNGGSDNRGGFWNRNGGGFWNRNRDNNGGSNRSGGGGVRHIRSGRGGSDGRGGEQ